MPTTYVIFDPSGAIDPTYVKTVSPLTETSVWADAKVYSTSAAAQTDCDAINLANGGSRFVGPRPPKPPHR